MAMATRKSPTPKFMKHSGSIQGAPDLSSRRGFSRGVGDKAEVKASPKSDRRKTRRAASLQ